MKRVLIVALLAFIALPSMGAKKEKMPENSDDRVYLYGTESGIRRTIAIPDIDSYHTYKCDFHMHTFYADAEVSPKGRVYEAWSEGLDVIAMTEHVGTHKTKGVMLKDYNLPPRLAQAEGKKRGMIVIKGVEITRDKPFGHMNALFLTDCNVFQENKYVKDSKGNFVRKEDGFRVSTPGGEESDFAAAEKQGAFIIWNHPGWPDKKCTLYHLQDSLMKQHRIHAVELCNHNEWYPKVLDWFETYHIPMMANTDQHMPSACEYGRRLRPMTLVFAEEYTEASIKEAMFAGRIVAFFDQKLAGDEKLLEQLVHHSLTVKVIDEKKGRIEVTNNSDIEFQTLYGDHMNPVIFYPRSARLVSVKKGKKIEFLNCYIGRNHLSTNLW